MPLDQLPIAPPAKPFVVPPPPPPPPPPEPQKIARSPEPPKRHEPVGPTVGIVIIVVLLLAGALYFWGEQLNRQTKNPPSYIPADKSAQ